MICSLQRTDVEAVEDDLALQFVPILLDLVVLDHDDYHVNIVEELVEVRELVLGNLLVFEEGVVALERTSEVTLLELEHLECGAFAEVVDILLVSETIKTNLAVVGDAFILHNLVDAVEDELGLAVVGFHALVNHLGETGIVSHEEPGID